MFTPIIDPFQIIPFESNREGCGAETEFTYGFEQYA